MASDNEFVGKTDVDTMKARLGGLDWQKVAGLMPAVVQDHHSGRVLMVAMMSEESLEKTLRTGQVTFFSRSRQRLWTKGETSGHYLRLQDIKPDCDGDSLLVSAVALGPTCHTGAESCFDSHLSQKAADSSAVGVLNKLWYTIEDRARVHTINALISKGTGRQGASDETVLGGTVRSERRSQHSHLSHEPVDKVGLVEGESAAQHSAKASYTARLLAEGINRCAQKVGEEGVEVALAGVSRDAVGVISEAADLVYHLFVLLKARGLSPEDVWHELARRYDSMEEQ